MKASIVFTDDQGKTWEFELKPVQAASNQTPTRRGKASPSRPAKEPKADVQRHTSPDFGISMAAFMSRYAKGGSGAQKFTILLARLTKGDTKTQVESKEIERQWKQMKRHLGEFNGAHGTRAKDAGWVDTPKRGFYVLLKDWQSALER